MIVKRLLKKSISYHQVIKPDDNTLLLMPNNPTRVIVYCHGAGEDREAIMTGGTGDALKVPLILEMLANKWAVLSHTAQGQNWGNAGSLTDYTNAISWAKTYTGLSYIDIFSQSMGGCSGLQVFANNSTIKHWLGIYPVCSLANMFTTSYKADIKTAYNFTNDSDYNTATAGHDPLQLASSLFTGRKMWLDASYGDTVVARSQNADMLFSKLNGIANITLVDANGNHGDPSHFLIPQIIAFLKS